ncbi:activating transcription factor 3 isoform X1 [Homalodisca vitripennis]|uniref:activating transcription factor 3 isoform X1 n=1 Tax=Homalodisca vitripennis TaxID=197043 RepID=UPI001EEA10FD|nr:activating transcription factor 3 isoform X1 [Homalodisca vitripennis]XP_046665727.1 activating transcription factor 3 isoform X1 [Homalodisca vitripennis]KAG8243351.1 Cyclic AMP-dependent transcription factor ATF-3 [Homalodisca vitripennis]
MYNLNVSGPGVGGSGLLSLPQGENSTTPRTPEILNSLIAMTNPFDSSYRAHAPRLASSPPGGSDTSTSSSGSPGCISPPSVQHTCSQLIKEGLKLTIQSKRRQSQRDPNMEDPTKLPRRDEVSCDGLGDDDDDEPYSGDGLTPEDEERRRRRRERNKIAATKCRLKKRERTVNLVQESEILENQNHDLKSQIQELETQRRRLVDMLSIHRPSCTKPQQTFSAVESTAFPTTTFQTFHRSMDSSNNMFRRMNMNTFPRSSTSVVDTTMTYRRVEMSSATCVEPYQRMETVLEDASYSRPSLDSNVYHNFESQEVKDAPLLVPYCRSTVSSVESPPSFTRIGEQYPCQNLTNLDQFVKPELPSMAGFSPVSSYGRPSNLDPSSVSPNYEDVNSPNLASNSYQQFDDESDTFSSGFSPTGLDRSCIT